MEGNVDVVAGTFVQGWVVSKKQDPCSIYVTCNNSTLYFKASLPRRDVAKKNICYPGAYVGFKIDLSSILSQGSNDIVITAESIDGPVIPGGRFSIDTNVIDNPHGSLLFKKNHVKPTVKVFGKFKLVSNPLSGSVLSKIFKILDVKVIDMASKDQYSLSLFFDDLVTTEDQLMAQKYRNQAKDEGALNTCNMDLLGTSKTMVGCSYEHAFNQKINLSKAELIDEASYVLKSEGQAAHDGTIQEGKSLKQSDVKGKVIQRLIDNSCSSNDYVVDYRIPVFKGFLASFVYIKTRPIGNRFANSNSHVSITGLDNIVSKHEREKIIAFCKHLKLDYGEIDVLRNNLDGLLYIVDVNNTPAGPTFGLTRGEYNLALRELALNFKKSFLMT